MAVPTTKQIRNFNKHMGYAGRDGQLGDRLQYMNTDGVYTPGVGSLGLGTVYANFEVHTNGTVPSLAISAYEGGSGDHTITLMAPATLGQATTLTVPDAGDSADTIALLDLAQTFTNKTLTTPTIASFTNATHDHADAAGGGNTLTIPTIGDFTNATHDHSNTATGGALSLSSALVGTNATTFEIDLDGSVPAVALGVGTTGNFTQTIKPAATITTGDVDLTLPDTANVDDAFVFVTLAQTLASKTLTAPTINACTITGAVTITTPSVTGTWTDLGAVTTVDINGGTIDVTPIGSTTPAAGAFTTLAASGASTLSDDVTIANGKDLLINSTTGSGYLQINAATSGALKLIPAATSTSTTTLTTSDCAGARTVTLPDATCTLLGTAAANTFTAVQTIAVDDASNTAVTEVLALKHSTNATAGTGIGTQLAFYVEDSADNLTEVADIEAVFSTATSGSEDCDLIFKTAFDTGTVATAMTVDASANELVLGEDTSLVTAMRIYPATTSYGSFVIKAGDDTGNNVTTLTTGVSAGTATLTLPVVTGTLSALNGTNTWSAVNTFSAEPVISMEDANATAVLDLLTLNRSVTGATAGGNDLGIGVTFEMEDDTGEEEKARLNIQQTTAARTTSDVDFIFSQNINGLVTETVRFDADAGVVVGVAAGSSFSSLRVYSSTASNGSILLAAADNTGNDTVTITNGTTTGDITITLPTVTSTLAVLGANSFTGAQTFGAGILASGAVANDFSAGSGTFLTSTGAVTIGPAAVGITGDVTLATTKSITAAAGSGSFDFSVATGAFDTSTGTNTLNGDVAIATGKDFSQAGTGTFATGTGAVSLLGDVEIKGDLDTNGAVAMTIGASEATSLVIGATDVATKVQASVLTLDSAANLTIQIAATDALQIDDSAISGFAAAGEAAGHAVYTETEDGGTAATTGSAGGLFNLKTGDGSAGLLASAGGAGGALAFATGDGGASVTGTPAASGAVTIATGTGGATTTSGTAAVSGNMTLTTGTGGASASGANAGGAAGAIALNGGTGGADSDSSDVGGVGGAVALLAGDGGTGATQGDGGAVSIDAGDGDTAGVIDIGTTNSSTTTIGVADAGVVQLQSLGLILDSENAMTFQIGTADIFQIDDAAITFAGGAATAGQDCYLGTETGGAASSVGLVGGLLNITTGAGSDAESTQTAAAGGALALATGIGGNSTTGTAGASGAMTLATGTAGATTTSGVGPVSGNVTISTGTGGIAKSGANGGVAGTISLLGGTGGLDEGAANIGGAGGPITLTAGTGGNGATGGAGGAVTIDAGAAGTGGSPVDGSIDIGTNNSLVTTVTGASLVLNSTGVGVLQAGGVDLLGWDDTAIAIAAAAATTAGQPCYLGTEAGGVASASAGAAGGLLNITTGAGSAAATTQTGGASGALALATGVGGNSTTGTAGASGAVTIASGTAGATTTSGAGPVSGNVTISTGTGGASEAGANAGGVAGTVTLQGGTGGEDVADADAGGVGGAVVLAGGTGGEGAAGGVGGAITVDAGAAGSGGSSAAGAITVGGTNAESVTIGRSTKKTKILGTFSAPQTVTLNFGDGAEDGDGAFTQGGGVIGGSDTTDTEAGATYCATYDKTNDEWVQLSTSSSGTDVSVNYQFFSDTKADDDAVYFGAAAKFCEMAVDMAVVQNYGGDALTWEYANSATPTWATLTVQYDGSDATAQDGKRSFGRDGAISFIPPAAWTASQPDAVLAAGGYYIRARITTTANMGAAEATTNSVQHYIVTPNADAPTCPVTGTITEARVVNANTTVHDQNSEFLLWNVTQNTFSATTAHTWAASQKIDLFGSLTLAVTATDKLGIIVLDDNNATVNPQFHVELKIAAA